MALRPYFNRASTGNYGIQGKRVNDVWFVVDFSFDLPLAYVEIASFTCVFNKYKFTIGAYFFNAAWTFVFN